MRKLNAIFSTVILILFLLHGVFGGFQLWGLGGTALKAVSWVALIFVVAHIIIGSKLTMDTFIAQRKAGVSYPKENQVFWVRRISGFIIMVLLIFHLTAFGYDADGTYRLHWFTAGKLVTQILLAATVAVHVISNVKPMLLSFGIKGHKSWAKDIVTILTVLLLFMLTAFVVYYLRWNVF